MTKFTCVRCEKGMELDKMGVWLAVYVGNTLEQIYSADLHKCSECGYAVIGGMGANAAERGSEMFDEIARRFKGGDNWVEANYHRTVGSEAATCVDCGCVMWERKSGHLLTRFTKEQIPYKLYRSTTFGCDVCGRYVVSPTELLSEHFMSDFDAILAGIEPRAITNEYERFWEKER